jgi:hypothetical protein
MMPTPNLERVMQRSQPPSHLASTQLTSGLMSTVAAALQRPMALPSPTSMRRRAALSRRQPLNSSSSAILNLRPDTSRSSAWGTKSPSPSRDNPGLHMFFPSSRLWTRHAPHRATAEVVRLFTRSPLPRRGPHIPGRALASPLPVFLPSPSARTLSRPTSITNRLRRRPACVPQVVHSRAILSSPQT